MKTQLVHRITNTVLATGMCLLPMVVQAAQPAHTTGRMENLVAGKFAVVGSITDLAELRSTLSYLDSVGMKGAFIISASEAKQYPENVKLIAKHGHTVILEMQGKQAEPKVVAGVEKAKPALKSVGSTTDTGKVRIERSKLTKKQRITRDFFGADENGRKIGLRYPGTAKPNENVPEWTLKALTKLSDYGLLSPTEISNILSEPNRELLAKLIARAYHENEESKGKNYYDAQFELDKLMVEYDTELRNLGYDAGRYAAFGGLPKERETKLGGELRYNYVEHSGDDPYNFFDSRVRLRLYVEQPLDDNWTLYGMGEGNKSWYRDIKHFNLERLYVSGQYKELTVTGGRFGEFYADGNVYDGRIDGVKFSGGKKVKLSGEHGRLRDDQRATALVATYNQPRYDAEAGLYILDKLKSYGSTTIGSLGGMYYIGNFGVGAMYLCSSRTSVTGGAGGYVVTLKYGRNRSWVPGTYEIFAKYYSQPEATYISHTMVGLADYMRGFNGFGVGWYYTLSENLVYGIEYNDLEEKGSGKKGRTLWNHVSLFF